ncbi:hypothetical protein HZC35_00395 [Candidatus Saganbacteria bacterium]|nr:hypothetical protein [Candidatus Saganbacteria bacterium]
MRRDDLRDITARRLIEKLPEATRGRIETRAQEERLDLEEIRLSEPELIYFLSRLSLPEAREEAADPVRLLRAISEGRLINEVRENGRLPSISIVLNEESLIASDLRLVDRPPEEVRRILEILREDPELMDILLHRLGLGELKDLHSFELLRHIVFGLLEYRAELGRFEFERRFGRGITAEAIAEAVRLGLLHDRLDVGPRWAPEWRMIRAAYVRGEVLSPDSIKWDSFGPGTGIRYLAGLRSTGLSEFRTDRLTLKNKIEGLVAFGATYLDILEALTRQESPLSVEQLLVTSDHKSILTWPAATAIIDAQAQVEVFGPIFELLVSKPEGLREEESRTILVGILSKETPDSILNRETATDSRPTAHEQLLAVIESQSPLQDKGATAEARKLLRRSPQVLYHAQRFIGSKYSHGVLSSFPQSEVGRFLLDLIEKTLGRPVVMRQGFLGSVFALAGQQIENDNLDMHGSVREILPRLAAAAAEWPEAKQIDRDAKTLSINESQYTATPAEQVIWKARGHAALLLLVRIFLSPDRAGRLPYEVSAQTALRAAEKLRGEVDYEKYSELAYIPYLPAFILARMGGEFRDKALDELKTALVEGGRNGLLAAVGMVQGVTRGEIYIDLANILKEIDRPELDPEIRLLGYILRSERLQMQYQENLFDLARLFLAEMPSQLLKELTDLIDTQQYEEVSVRVEKWIKERLQRFADFTTSAASGVPNQ